jgi:hypothetical protein
MSRYTDPNERCYADKLDRGFQHIINKITAEEKERWNDSSAQRIEDISKSVSDLKGVISAVTEERDIRKWIKSDIAKIIAQFGNPDNNMSSYAILTVCWHYFHGALRVLNLVAAEDESEG